MSSLSPVDSNRSMLSRSFLPLALITLGVVFLLGNMIPGPARGGLVLLGLGAAFGIGRLTTGRYGYSVPAGILVAIGTYVVWHETAHPEALLDHAAWFFVLLGGGFVLTYFLGMRPQAVWPLFPAAVLILLGLVLFGWASLAPVASFAWIVSYWPAVLVLVGLWLLFRDQLPRQLRAPVATLGGIALLAYGVLAAVASVAVAGSLTAPGFMARFSGAPYNDQLTFDQPLSSGQAFTVSNSSGRTLIRAGTGSAVHVVANRHFWNEGQPPEVRLQPSDRGAALDFVDAGRAPFGPNNSVDFEIEVPQGVLVTASSSSGLLTIADVTGAVDATTSSGRLELTNVSGDVKAVTSSGDIRGSGLRHVRQVQTSSGDVVLSGIFDRAATVQTSSGDVQLTLGPGSAVQLNVRTNSGDISARSLGLERDRNERRTMTASVGNPAADAVLSIQTSSGDVSLRQP
jgi:hypothetical protein